MVHTYIWSSGAAFHDSALSFDLGSEEKLKGPGQILDRT
jgi:hypothetical protein